MKEKKTEEITQQLAAADKRLHDIQSQMQVPNVIRTMIEDGKTIEDIREYVLSIIQIGATTKADALKEIEQCHLALAERHMKLTDNWQFCWIKERKTK